MSGRKDMWINKLAMLKPGVRLKIT